MWIKVERTFHKKVERISIDVTHVMVGGECLVKDSFATFVDEAALVDEVQQRALALSEHV